MTANISFVHTLQQEIDDLPLQQEIDDLRAQAATLPEGPRQDRLVKRADELEVTMKAYAWAASPGVAAAPARQRFMTSTEDYEVRCLEQSREALKRSYILLRESAKVLPRFQPSERNLGDYRQVGMHFSPTTRETNELLERA